MVQGKKSQERAWESARESKRERPREQDRARKRESKRARAREKGQESKDKRAREKEQDLERARKRARQRERESRENKWKSEREKRGICILWSSMTKVTNRNNYWTIAIDLTMAKGAQKPQCANFDRAIAKNFWTHAISDCNQNFMLMIHYPGLNKLWSKELMGAIKQK